MNDIDKLTLIGLIDVIQTRLYDLQESIRTGGEAQYVYDKISENLKYFESMKRDIISMK